MENPAEPNSSRMAGFLLELRIGRLWHSSDLMPQAFYVLESLCRHFDFDGVTAALCETDADGQHAANFSTRTALYQAPLIMSYEDDDYI